jgi:antitoxin ParD1/3/4
MAVRRTITVSITQEQDDLIKACLHSDFASTSEVVRAALRLLQRDEIAQQVRKPRPACSKGTMHG